MDFFDEKNGTIIGNKLITSVRFEKKSHREVWGGVAGRKP